MLLWLGQEQNTSVHRARLCTDPFLHTGLYTSVHRARLCTEGGSVHKCARCTLVYRPLSGPNLARNIFFFESWLNSFRAGSMRKDFHGISMGFHRISMGFPGDFHGISMRFMGFPWHFHGIPWNFYGISILIGFPWHFHRNIVPGS